MSWERPLWTKAGMNEKPYNLIFGPKGNVKAILMKSFIEGSEYFSILFGHWFHSILTQSFSRTNVKYEIANIVASWHIMTWVKKKQLRVVFPENKPHVFKKINRYKIFLQFIGFPKFMCIRYVAFYSFLEGNWRALRKGTSKGRQNKY